MEMKKRATPAAAMGWAMIVAALTVGPAKGQEVKMSTPKKAVLENTFSIEPFGCDAAHLADLDGDGRLDLLILQTAGQFCSELYRDRTDVDDADRSLYCLTAFTLTGKVLWQDGKPYDRDFPFTSHGVQGGGLMLSVADIDNDGRSEVIVIRHSELVLLEAATGKKRASVRLPADNFVSLCVAQLGPREHGRQIICKVNDKSYKPWNYANPVIAYNADLTIYREPFAVKGAGHNIVVMDINGDGRDEVFIGYSLLDHELNPIWSLDLGPGFNYSGHHADHIAVSDLNGDGKLEVRYSGSEDFFVADLDGKILWKAKAGHSQSSIAGDWGPQGETRIVMAEKNRGLWGLDAGGKILWHRKDINGYAIADVRWSWEGPCTSWALFRPQLKPMRPTPYESDPAWSAALWPRFLDGDGNLHDVFPYKDEYAQPKQLIRAERSYDCGVKYYPIARDLDGDGLDEVVIYDRRRVWVFRSPG